MPEEPAEAVVSVVDTLAGGAYQTTSSGNFSITAEMSPRATASGTSRIGPRLGCSVVGVLTLRRPKGVDGTLLIG